MDGGLCFNEWLIREGYLTLKEYPAQLTKIADLSIDWSRTKAWGDGGYYGRLFLNVKGREPEGIIDPDDYESVRTELIQKIEAIEGPDGGNLGSAAHRPEDLYREVKGVAPDLIVYFGDLGWRSVGSVGHGSIHTFENDTGSDEANHDWNGMFILNKYGCRIGNLEPGLKEGLRIYDIAPTVLDFFGMKFRDEIIGKSLTRCESGGLIYRLKKLWS